MGAMVVRAGIEALKLQDGIRGTKKADNTLVTLADKQTEEFLIRELRRYHPEASILGEESLKNFRATSAELNGPLYIIDPIDGTAMYASGLPNWGVSLGYASGGRMREGVIFMPSSGELYLTKDGRALSTRFPLDAAGIPQIDSLDLEAQISSGLAGITPREAQLTPLVAITQWVAKEASFRVPYILTLSGSFVLAMINTAKGSYSGQLSMASLWDVAGSWPIARALGVKSEMLGIEVDFDAHLQEGPWNLDPDGRDFLKLQGPVLFYRDQELRDRCIEACRPWLQEGRDQGRV